MGKKGLIIVVSAPSGGGKTTLVSGVLAKLSGIGRSISYTTREIRNGEVDGEDYIFVSEEEFRKKINSGDFMEWEEKFGNNYGTCRIQIEEMISKGEDVVLSIDVKGARSVKKIFPESVSIFIMPPSEKELERRLKDRKTESGRQLAVRLGEAKREMSYADEFDYLIINDDLEEATEDMMAVIKTERGKPKTKD